MAHFLAVAAALAVGCAGTFPVACAGEPQCFLEAIHRHRTLASTVADNGDLNPYAVIVAPVSAGKIQKGDVWWTISTRCRICKARARP